MSSHGNAVTDIHPIAVGNCSTRLARRLLDERPEQEDPTRRCVGDIQRSLVTCILVELNGQQVKLAKFIAFDWHSHADEDEMFL